MFCTSCGASVSDGTKFCPSCGSLMASQRPPMQPPPMQPPPMQPPPMQPAPMQPPAVTPSAPTPVVPLGRVMDYATWANRVVGYLIDTLLVAPVMLILYF